MKVDLLHLILGLFCMQTAFALILITQDVRTLESALFFAAMGVFLLCKAVL